MCLSVVQSPHRKPHLCSFLPQDLCTYCSLALSQDTQPPRCPFLFTGLVIPGPPVSFRLRFTLSGKPDLTVKLRLFLPDNVFSWHLSCRHFSDVLIICVIIYRMAVLPVTQEACVIPTGTLYYLSETYQSAGHITEAQHISDT